jgi:hypothetical protein
MGLPDVTAMQKKLVSEMERRMMEAMETASDPEALLKTWFGWGNQGLEQFQRFVRDSAARATTTTKDKPQR